MFRSRIVGSILSGRPIKITEIREHEEAPGLQDFEASFLRLVEQICNGCKIEINEMGTTMTFVPGFIRGGKIEHSCACARSIGWYLEGLIPILAFAKTAVTLTLRGVTNDDLDLSVDTIKEVTIPLLAHFGLTEGVKLDIKKRGAPPAGGGEVIFTCPTLRSLTPVHLIKDGFVKRIRGVAYSTRIAPQMSNRMVEHARTLLNTYIPDVYIFTDHYKGAEGGKSPGFGLSLTAITTEGVRISAEGVANSKSLPEDLGAAVSRMLCEEIAKGGCVDTSHQPLCCLLMALGPEDVSRVRIGKISESTIAMLRLIKDFFGTVFKLAPDEETKTVFLSCLGTGYTNISRKIA